MGTSEEIFSGVTSLAISLSVQNPVLASVIDKTLQPLLSSMIDELKGRILGVRENKRICEVFNNALNKINLRLEKGDIPRQDESFWVENTVDLSDAKSILEGVLLKARDEYEEKKLPYYSNLIAQMVFDTSWSYQRLNAMIRLFEQLSYRQLQLMALALKNNEIETPQWDIKFKRTLNSYAYYDLFCEVNNLSNLALFHQSETSLTMGLGDKQALSPIGKSMAELMELSSIPQNELDDLNKIIHLLNNEILKM